MTNNRRYRKSAGRHVWVFSETNPDITPKEVARILASAALAADAQAKRERADDTAQVEKEDTDA